MSTVENTIETTTNFLMTLNTKAAEFETDGKSVETIQKDFTSQRHQLSTKLTKFLIDRETIAPTRLLFISKVSALQPSTTFPLFPAEKAKSSSIDTQSMHTGQDQPGSLSCS